MLIDELREYAKEKASQIILAQPEHLTPLKQLEKIENLIDIVIEDILQQGTGVDVGIDFITDTDFGGD